MKEKGHEQDLPGLLGRAGPTSTTCSQCGANLAAGETNGTTGALDQAGSPPRLQSVGLRGRPTRSPVITSARGVDMEAGL
jgi:hypothetical protein